MRWNTNLTVLTVLFVSVFVFSAQSQIGKDRDPSKPGPGFRGIEGHDRPLEILSQELVLLEAQEAKTAGMDCIQIRQSKLDQIAPIGKLRIQMQDGSVREMDLKNVRKVILEPMAEFDIKKKKP